MLQVEASLSPILSSLFIAGTDFSARYLQLSLDAASQSLVAFMTADDIVQPSRTTQGGRNSPAYFEAKVEPWFATLQDHLPAWLDDFVLHASTGQELLDVLEKFLQKCAERNRLISILKSGFFATSIEWFGGLIVSYGVRISPARYSALANASEPRTGAELSQYLHCIKWMSS